MHCIFHNIIEIPICETCHQVQLNMRDIRIYDKTPRFCSSKCSMNSAETQCKMHKTMKDRYGVEHALQNEEIKNNAMQHGKETNLKRYGVESVFSLPEVQQKKEQTNISRYGVRCTLQASCVQEKIKKHNLETYGVEHHMQNKEIYDKSRKTCKELYGDEHPMRTQPIKDKLMQTNRDLYGVDWTFQSENNKQKSKQTCQDRFGTDYALQASNVKQKIKDTLYDNYGVLHNSQIPGIRSKMCLRYSYDGYSFDSSIELCFYIWLVDNNIPFTYQPDDFFEYEYDGMIKHYCPDFKIGDMFFEIKGDHFFENKDPTKRMICPWDHK